MPEEIEKDEATPSEDKLDDLLSMEGYDKPVRRARIILFIVAALQAIPIFTWVDLPEPTRTINIAINVFELLVFCALALWTVKKPYYAIIGGIVFYTMLIIFYATINPASIIQGFIVKIVIYLLLVVGLSNAKDVQQWKDSKNDY